MLDIPKTCTIQEREKEMLEDTLRAICISILERIPINLPKEEIIEIIDTIKFSDSAEEIEEALNKAIENLSTSDEQELISKAESIIYELCEILNKNKLEVPTPQNLTEALDTITEMIKLAKEKLDFVPKETIERIKEYLKDLIVQIGSHHIPDDAKFIIDTILSRIEEDKKALFNPEIYRRIQDIILEREKELEIERAKVREKLKLVIKSIVDSLNSLSDSETSIVSTLNAHVTDIENIAQLDNIDEITEKLSQLSRDLKSTIVKVKREINKTRKELEKSAQTINHLKEELEKLKEKTIIDELTQILNRRGIMEFLTREYARSKRFKSPLSVLMIDIDDFKKVNDTYGHTVGDKVLKTIAQILKTKLRATDVVGRYGGEEFLVVLPETDLQAALTVAEKLRTEVAKKTFKYKDQVFKVTISLGAAQLKEGESIEELINRADQALYTSKRSGKNRTTLAK